MATVQTTTYSADTAITFDISSLATSSTFVTGRNSTQVDNTTTKYLDAIVDVEGITGHTSTTNTVGQQLLLYIYGGDTSFATKNIGGASGIDGADGDCTLTATVLQSLIFVKAVSAVVTTAGLVYYIPQFSVAQFFGNVLPKFWGLYLSHNFAGALAASQSALFSFNGITYTAT